MSNSTAHNETGKLNKIVLRKAEDAFVSQAKVNEQWERLNYFGCPEFEKAVEEYKNFAEIIEYHSEQTIYLPKDENLSIDSIYVRDSLITTEHGLILCNMGKDARKNEPTTNANYLGSIGLNVLGEITGSGSIEGGDMIYLDSKTIAVGHGYRTNSDGINQLKELTSDFIEEIITVPLPHYLGENDVFHLMSIISPIDKDLAVVYSKLMPVSFRQELIRRGIDLIEVVDEEFDSMGCNILALAPRKCLMLSGNPITKKRLLDSGVEVIEYDGDNISRLGAGGPTCLTRPIDRII